MKRTGKELVTFIRNVKKDYKSNGGNISKRDKSRCFWRIVKNLLLLVWGIITAPFIYPIWYAFRKKITEKIHRGTSWQEIQQLIKDNNTETAKSKLRANGKFLYWLWTYGDIDDPLGRGGMPDSWGKNSFWHRFKWSAIRNARFNVNYMCLRTSTVTEVITTIDTRNFRFMHKSFGVGDTPDGASLRWAKDDHDNWYFFYEEGNTKSIFWFGYVGLNAQGVGNKGLRFEAAYRVTDSSYRIW